MTRKHFVQLADAIREHNEREPKDHFSQKQLHTLAMFLKRQNPDFMMERWHDHINGGERKGK